MIYNFQNSLTHVYGNIILALINLHNIENMLSSQRLNGSPQDSDFAALAAGLRGEGQNLCSQGSSTPLHSCHHCFLPVFPCLDMLCVPYNCPPVTEKVVLNLNWIYLMTSFYWMCTEVSNNESLCNWLDHQMSGNHVNTKRKCYHSMFNLEWSQF